MDVMWNLPICCRYKKERNRHFHALTAMKVKCKRAKETSTKDHARSLR
jgi:hypothetical protein